MAIQPSTIQSTGGRSDRQDELRRELETKLDTLGTSLKVDIGQKLDWRIFSLILVVLLGIVGSILAIQNSAIDVLRTKNEELKNQMVRIETLIQGKKY